MSKREINDLVKKYKLSCVCCPYTSELGPDKYNTSHCSNCDKFSREDAQVLLDYYYKSRHPDSDTSRLGLSDEVLDRIFELHFSGATKYSIVSTINNEFPKTRNGKPVPTINWKQVHWVIENKGYTSQDAKTRISASRERVRRYLDTCKEVDANGYIGRKLY